MKHLLTGMMLALFAAAPAHAADRVSLDDASVHFFLIESGEFTPDLLQMKNPIVFNLSMGADGYEGGKFSGFLVKVHFSAPGEAFADGKLATLQLRNTRTKKIVETRAISNVYVGSTGKMFYPAFFQNRDCGPYELIVMGKSKRITKALEIHCGE
jgi:hypothetical protein